MNNNTLELFDEFEYQKYLVVYDKTPTKILAYERDNPYIEYDIPNEVAVPESDIARFYPDFDNLIFAYSRIFRIFWFYFREVRRKIGLF